jgi:hypothetical protein
MASEEKRYFAGYCMLTKENRREYWIIELHEDRSQSEFYTLFHKLWLHLTKFYGYLG